MKRLHLLLVLFFPLFTFSQVSKTVLFIGNSYTAVNDLPYLVSQVAASFGDSLNYDSNTPGGYTLQLHSTNSTTISKINSNNWDVVVLQEQSQLPSFPYNQVLTDVYPYADSLDRVIKEHDSCTLTMFFMTWGRKNGDATNCPTWPPVCTYSGMQTLLRDRYVEMGSIFDAAVCPVGAAWRDVRDTLAGIELYQLDESHPSLAGSYLAACTFYASIWHKSPIGAIWPLGIDSNTAFNLQYMADKIVFDSLQVWNIDTNHVVADFTYILNTSELQLANSSVNADSVFWDFGDGTFSSLTSPVHYYASTGVFDVMLVAFKGCESDTITEQITVSVLGSNYINADSRFILFPNPAATILNISWSADLVPVDYSIANISGEFVQKGRLERSISVTCLKPGFYFFVAQFSDFCFITRFEIKR